VVTSDHEVASLPLSACFAFTCSACLALKDPYCSWDTTIGACILNKAAGVHLLQDLLEGSDRFCPPEAESTTPLNEEENGEFSLNHGECSKSREAQQIVECTAHTTTPQ